MKLKEIVKNLEILDSTADMEMEIGGISYDSRKTGIRSLLHKIQNFICKYKRTSAPCSASENHCKEFTVTERILTLPDTFLIRAF